MFTHRKPRARDQRGVTLIEILVAVAIFAVAAVIALTIYDLSRKSFKKGENLTEQQQAVRIAFDRLAADLRMTGFNYNPDGAKNRPDEQIEAAYDTAIVIRADFDAEDPTAAATPESTMIGTDFLAVSVGNDEIAAYVLAKPDGSSSGALRFRADISNPRDGVLETVVVPNVAMVQNDPPYTLYRVTFNNDDSTFGGAGFFTRTPLIENVYSMNFRYYNQVGVQQNNTFDLTTLTDDIGGMDTADRLVARAAIRRYGVEVVGLTRDPDLQWTDAGDPYPATRKFRKFALSSDVQPRNIGMVGVKDLEADVTPPSKPATPSLVPGHCGGLLLAWTENPVEDEVAYYRVNYGTSPGAVIATRTSNSNRYYLGGLTHGTTYYVSIQAVDSSGNVSVKSNEASTTTTNVNTPSVPQDVVASTDLNGAVNVTWSPVTTNTASLPGSDPIAPRIRDLAGYRVYRGLSGSFGGASEIANESILKSDPSPNFPDTQVVNCRDYNYWVKAVDTCGVESAASARATGNAVSAVAPMAPAGAQAFFSGLGDVQLSWQPVTQDVNGRDVFIDTYVILRTDLVAIGDTVSDADFREIDRTQGQTAYLDNGGPIPDPLVATRYYRIQAVDDCNNLSAPSQAVSPTCAFSGDVGFDNPRNNEPVAGVVPVTVSVANGSDTYVKVLFTFRHRTTGAETTAEVSGSGPSWTYNWLADPPGPYTIYATVYNDLGCGKTAQVDVAAGYDVGCCLSPPNPDTRPIVLTCVGSGNAKCAPIQYEVINNNCLTAVAIERMTVTWTDLTGNNPRLDDVRFDGSSIWNPAIPLASPANNVFSDPKPSIGVDRNSTFPVRVTYVYDANMARRQGQDVFRNTLTTSYSFRLLNELGEETAITGVCGPSTGMFDTMVVENP